MGAIDLTNLNCKSAEHKMYNAIICFLVERCKLFVNMAYKTVLRYARARAYIFALVQIGLVSIRVVLRSLFRSCCTQCMLYMIYVCMLYVMCVHNVVHILAVVKYRIEYTNQNRTRLTCLHFFPPSHCVFVRRLYVLLYYVYLE